ncbi:MAG TPA: nitrogenase iron-molybdenum cofactor biosynthesis protein NifE [Chitinispirillaceae bacterium]|nr:nitrogenase iron-molybdenum cofactor biosynthesis protein NifE [Chitinispirillaceae bacterium]
MNGHITNTGGKKTSILEERVEQVVRKGSDSSKVACERKSAAGSVSQRACVFCGSRVVLYPIADALHLVHGPVGCAAYTWDIRGALSSGPELHRTSFSTDLHEKEIIYGGEKKLRAALSELIPRYKPSAAFVYATCITGIIGDDIESVCKSASVEFGIPVLPVHSEGFKGTKKDGYRAACDALLKIIGLIEAPPIKFGINLIGEFNVAGETWLLKDYFARMGLKVVATITGDGRVEDIMRAHTARLNIVQCSGSMMHLAKEMKEKYGIPFIRASFFGIDDTAKALYDAADFFNDKEISGNTSELIRNEISSIRKELDYYKSRCQGKRAALYVGGAFKAMSLVKALRLLGMKTVIAGTQTGNAEDYEALKAICDKGTIIVDDSNPMELSSFLKEKKVDLFVGGVKERPIAYKMGIGFCDHNHERKIGLAGFFGMVNFAKEVYSSVTSPVWGILSKRAGE